MTVDRYVCPRDKSRLYQEGAELICSRCSTRYPLVGEVPILIDDDNSVFSRADYLGDRAYEGASYGTASDSAGGARAAVRKAALWLSEISVDLSSVNSHQAVEAMGKAHPDGQILVIGSGEAAFDHPRITYSDVALGSRTSCICDAHSLPFPDGTFAGVVAVAVLEHVADPNQCVSEIHRVLCGGGLVYAVTPFLQPVHMGAHDFTRFTYLGHRRLFRWFDDVESGCALGAATSTAYVISGSLACISNAKWSLRLARLSGLFIAAFVKQFDRMIGRRLGAYDTAAAVFFFGRKRDTPITDKQLIRLYRGAQVSRE